MAARRNGRDSSGVSLACLRTSAFRLRPAAPIGGADFPHIAFCDEDSRRGLDMKKRWKAVPCSLCATRSVLASVAALLLAAPAFAQGGGNSPWENAVSVLQTAFTS